MHLSLSITSGCGAHSDANLPVCSATRKRYAADQKRDSNWPAQCGKLGARTGRQDAGMHVWTIDRAAMRQAPHDGSWCTAALTSATACTPSWNVCAPHMQRV